MEPDKKQEFVTRACQRLLKETELPRSSAFNMLTWDQVRAMQDVFEFGGHTKRHCTLSTVHGEALKEEIYGSKLKIEEELQKDIIHFAYPNGLREDFTNEAIGMLAECGYKTAVTTIGGLNHHLHDMYQLKRMALPVSNSLLSLLLLGFPFIEYFLFS